jgi:four helix bundle protein
MSPSSIAERLRERTFNYALRTLRYCRSLPNEWDIREIAKQLIRAGNGTAANYWSACRGRSDREFIAKLGVAEDEAAESVLWLMLILQGGIREDAETKTLLQDGREITAILSASHKTAKDNRRKRKQRTSKEKGKP